MLLHSVIEVDDDIVPDNRIESTITGLFISSEGTIENKTFSGYLEPYSPFSCDITTLEVSDIDVVIGQYDVESADAATVQYAKNVLDSTFPSNKVLMISNNMDLLIANPDEAIDMLEKMIAHIKISRK